MEDAIGMGNSLNFKRNSKPLGCKMSAQSAGTEAATGWSCDKVYCPSYGKWYCPFSW